MRITTGTRSWLRLGAAGIGFVAFAALLLGDRRNGTLRDGFVPQTIGWYLLAFVAFGLAIAAVELGGSGSTEAGDTGADGADGGGKVPWTWLWLFPILFRILLLFTEPTLSDDVYRYLWDGHLLGNGVNPYLHPVEAVELNSYDVGLRSQVNNPGLSTPYLPAAEVLFAAIAKLLPLTATSVQATMIAFDLATAGIIVKLLARAGLPSGRVVLYLWNPLVIVEVAHGAHLDAFMVALTLGAVLASLPTVRPSSIPVWQRVGPLMAAAGPLLLAAATLTRGLPALAAAVLWWRWTWPQRLLYTAACIVPVAAFARGPGLGLGPEALSSGTGVFGAARAYGERWQFNGSVFNWILSALDGAEAEATARLVVGALMAAATLAIAYRSWRRTGPGSPIGHAESRMVSADLQDISLLMMAYVLLTTTVNPWYLIIVLALLPFWTPAGDRSSGGASPAGVETGLWNTAGKWIVVAPWYYLAAAMSLSYLTYLDPDAHAELAWVRRVEWWPTMLLLVLWLLWSKANRSYETE